jgi:hypothetical protein
VSKLKARLTYANVTATIALFLALGGGAFAALRVPKKSVGPKQLKASAVINPKLADAAVTELKLAAGAVTSAKLAAGAVTDPKVAGGTLTAGKIASDQVVKGVIAREVVHQNMASGAFFTDNLQCPGGEQAVGGGAGGTTVGTRTYPSSDFFTQIQASAPIDANNQATVSGQVATGWHIAVTITSGASKDVRTYVLCAQR